MLKKIFSLFDKRRASQETSNPEELTTSLHHNLQRMRPFLLGDHMVKYREFESNDRKPLKCCAIFIAGMVNQEMIHENIIAPIQRYRLRDQKQTQKAMSELVTTLKKKVILSSEITSETHIYRIVNHIMDGETAILVDHSKEVILIDTRDFDRRAVSEPTTENVTRGPKEAFTESLQTNLTMIRRRIRTHRLKFQYREIGRETTTRISTCFIQGIVNQKMVDEVHKRLDTIDIDGVLDSEYIEELIRDHPLSLFKTINHTERPDSIAANLLEGRVALLVEGSPFALSMPFLFIEYIQNPEDYYIDTIFASFLRIIRFLGFFIAISLPSIYVALTAYHKEMLPTPLLLSIFAARQAVPFPVAVETLLLVIIFDILRETGARMPSPIGSTISFLGAIIIGQSAVEARLVSPVLVVIVAMTGISSFLLPKMYNPLALTRLLLLAWSSFLGLYGFIFGMIGLLIHLISMRSFGIPYLLGTGTLEWEDIRDTAIRAPWWLMYYRPKLIGDRDPVRQKPKREEK